MVDYEAIKAKFVEPVCEKIIIELLIKQGVNVEFLDLFYKFVVEI